MRILGNMLDATFNVAAVETEQPLQYGFGRFVVSW
jgi:hypothetical protein